MTTITKLPPNHKERIKDTSNLRAFFRLISFGLVACSYFLVTLPLFPLFLVFPYSIRKIYNYILSFYSRCLLVLMGINIKTQNLQMAKARGKLLVGNHMSYIDVLIAAAINPGCFVTSVEMKKTPFLGQICQLGGCVFVERRNKRNLKNEIREITESLNNGLDVFIFPEATSTNGDDVLRFRRPLFNSAIEAGVDVLPFTINYDKINGVEVDLKNRDLVCWYGEMTFFKHLWDLFSINNIDVSLNFYHRLRPNPNAQHLAEKSQLLVKSLFRPFHQRESNF